MFAGSDAGGQRAAIIYSLVASCKLCKVDPFAYLRDVIERVSTHPAKQIAALAPRGWRESSRDRLDMTTRLVSESCRPAANREGSVCAQVSIRSSTVEWTGTRA